MTTQNKPLGEWLREAFDERSDPVEVSQEKIEAGVELLRSRFASAKERRERSRRQIDEALEKLPPARAPWGLDA